MRESGRVIRAKLACPLCPSSDAWHIYEKPSGQIDGYCFSCHGTKVLDCNPGRETTVVKKTNDDWKAKAEQLPFAALTDRGISEGIARAYGVRAEYDTRTGEIIKHWYPYYKGADLVGYKVRVINNKDFYSVGSIRDAEPFGSRGVSGGGQMIMVTEGECDAMAAKQLFMMQKKNYQVISVKSGSSGIKGLLETYLETLSSFDRVIIAFDMDEPGQKAARELADKLPPGKGLIMDLPDGFKDINDVLRANKASILFTRMNSAKPVTPACFVSGEETWDLLVKGEQSESVAYPKRWALMNHKTYGVRLGELDTWTSGSGMGKTAFFRELQYHLLEVTKANIGIISLEEPGASTVKGLIALHLNKRIQLPDVVVPDEDLRQAWEETWGTDRLVMYNAFADLSDQTIIDKIRWMAVARDCKYIFVDHLSILVSETAVNDDERKRIDVVMTKLKKLTQELGIWIGLISHLRKPPGDRKSFEEGAVPSLSDLRGSTAIYQLSDTVIGISRNQQHKDAVERNTSQLHVLKSRFTGNTGQADRLLFDIETGRLG